MRNGFKKFVESHDEMAFRSLFLRFGPKLRAMLMRQGADSETADDIVQDTMLVVWSKSGLFAEDRGTVSSWIYTIARNLRTDRLRRQIVWERVQDDLSRAYFRDGAKDDPAQRAQDRQQITQALNELPAEQLEVIRLSLINGLSQTEIAERLGLPIGTVKSRMRLAVEKMRGSVEGKA